ncbi:hypothetical protein AX17_004413, partial [Amanita inopinata Kibby_2008]
PLIAMPSVSCKHCNAIFATTEERHMHIRSCVPSITLEFSDSRVDLQRNSDGDFICYCSHPKCPRAFKSSHSIKRHAKEANSRWIGPSETKIDDKARGTPSAESGSDKASHTDIKSQIVSTSYLDSIGLVVNNAIHAFICKACKIALAAHQVSSHYRSQHGKLNITIFEPDIRCAAQKLGVEMEILSVIGRGPVDEVQGLAIFDGMLCDFCERVYCTVGSMKKHHRSLHGDLDMPSSWRQVKAQQLNWTTHKSYFRIRPTLAPETPLTPSSTADKIHAQTKGHLDMTQPIDDARLLSPWLSSTRWHEHIKDYSVTELKALIAPSKDDREYPGLHQSLHHLLFGAAKQISTLPELILQKLNTPDPAKTGISNTPFHLHQNENTTLKQYIVPTHCLLLLLLRPKDQYQLHLPEHVQHRVNQLMELLKKDEAETNYNARAFSINNLLMSLWMHTWPTTRTGITDPTIVCVMLMSLNHDGRFSEPQHITGIIAKFTYTMRLAFIVEICRQRAKKPMHSIMDIAKAYEPWHTEKEDSTFNSLQSLQHRASSLAYSTMSLPRVWYTDRVSFRTLLYKGNKIHFQSLCDTFISMEQEAKELWEKEVLLDLPLKFTYGMLKDDLSNTAAGYSLLSESSNGAKHVQTALLTAVLSTPHLCNRFVMHCDYATGLPLWNTLEFRAWLMKLSKLEGILLARCEMLAGSPARGTEITCMSVCNTSLRSRRNLVAFGDYLAILCLYHKGSAMTGRDKLIPHAVDAFTADLMLQVLTIARPFAQIAAHLCYPNDSRRIRVYHDFLFVNMGQLFTTPDLTKIIEHYTRPQIGIGIGVNAWRHISTAFRRKICNSMDELVEEDEMETVGALQAGHSRKTENRIYGLSPESLAGAAEDILPLYLEASTDWQIACQVVPGGLHLSYQEAESKHFAQLEKAGVIRKLYVSRGYSNGLAGVVGQVAEQLRESLNIRTPEEQASELLKALAPELQRLIKTELGNLLLPMKQAQPPLAIMEPPQASESTTIAAIEEIVGSQMTRRETDELEHLALQVLCSVLKNPTARWTCPEQKEGVIALLKNETDVLAVMATGSGKTMLCVIPAMMEEHQVTVVVLPLKSLMTDYKRKLHAMNVEFEQYEGGKTRQLTGMQNLVLVSADMARTADFRQCISELHEKREVARIIFDECHFALTASDYRPALRNLAELRILPVPLCLMSGTVPPELEEEMKEAFGVVESAIVLRTGSDRPELKYMLEDLRPDFGAVMQRTRQILAEEMKRFRERDRGLVFVPFIGQGSQLAGELGCEFYNGSESLSDGERKKIYDKWISGVQKLMVCTSAFGTGNDYGHVRVVIHAGTPPEMIGFVQEVSRGGRDHEAATCYVLP